MSAELLHALLLEYSPTFREGEAIKTLGEFVSERLSYDVTWVDSVGNFIARYGRGRRTVALIGHIDTVTGELPVVRAGNVLRGRGAVDAKGPLAAAFVGASSVSEEVGEDLTVYAIAVVGEEGPSHGAWNLIKEGWRFDHVVILEPTNGYKVVTEYRGSAVVEIRCRSGGGHTSTPWITDSACDKIFKIWDKVSAAVRASPPKVSDLSLAMVYVQCGENENVLPRTGRLLLNARIPYGLGLENLEKTLSELLPDGCGLSVKSYTPPVKVSVNNPVPRSLIRAILKQGVKALPARKSGTSDMNIMFGRVTNDIAAYGPGKSELSHTELEEITVEELDLGARVYAEALRELAIKASRDT